MDNEDKLFIRDLTVRTKRGYLCIRVMRKWTYNGNVPGGPVLYMGLLFADEQGGAIYAQIPDSQVQRLGSQLILDRVYTIRRFTVRVSKTGYVPFDAGLMIQITAFTTITPAKAPVDQFPKILYQITPFNNIRTSGDATSTYIDVIGIVTAEDLPKTACPRGKEYVSILKEITITDLNGASLTVTLWEDHVHQFEIKDPSPTERAHSIVALFCGCLPKKNFGKTQVNAGTACRWFINPDIPKAQPFYDSFKTNPVPIDRAVQVAPPKEIQVQPKILEHKTIAEMNALNPYEFPEEGCKCTVAISNIPLDQEWWYMGCELCKRRLRNNGGSYYCNKCRSSAAKPLYKLTFFAADKTGEACFFCYDVNARQIIRRNCDSLLRAANNVSGLPDQIVRIVGRTYTFSVGLTEQSYNSMDSRAYLVNSCVFRSDPQALDTSVGTFNQPQPQLALQPAQEPQLETHAESSAQAANIADVAENTSVPVLGCQTPPSHVEPARTADRVQTPQSQTPPPQPPTLQARAKGTTDMSQSTQSTEKVPHNTVRKRLLKELEEPVIQPPTTGKDAETSKKFQKIGHAETIKKCKDAPVHDSAAESCAKKGSEDL